MTYSLYLLMEGSEKIFSTLLSRKRFALEAITNWADKEYWEAMKTSPLSYYPSATVVAICDSEPMTISFARPQDSNMAGHQVWSVTPDKNIVDRLIAHHIETQKEA